MANIDGNDVPHHVPDPAMRRLGIITGRWFTQGTVETDPVSMPALLEAEDTYEWLPGGRSASSSCIVWMAASASRRSRPSKSSDTMRPKERT